MKNELASAEVLRISFEHAQSDLNEFCGALQNDMLVIDDVARTRVRELPMQVGFLVFALCTEGEAEFTIGEQRERMRPRDLLISIGEKIFLEQKVSPDFHAKAVLMSQNFVQESIAGLSNMWPYLLHLMKNPIQQLTEEEQTWVDDCYMLIRRRLQRDSEHFMRDAVINLTRAFYFEVCNLLERRVHMADSYAHNRAYAIFDRFIALVSQHYKTERSVEWYSNELCITPKHLSEVVKAVSGKTAGQWITTLVVTEIKTLLKYSPLSIKEIATEMSFPNQSFLGKYFKNVEGISPSDYRRGVEA